MIYAVHMTDAERAELERRLAEIETQIAAATSWGAHLTVLDEERRGIRRSLEWADQKKGRLKCPAKP